MSKNRKRKTMVIISMVLVLTMLGGICAWADDPEVNRDPVLPFTVTTYNAMGGNCSVSFSCNYAGDTYGSVPVPTKYGWVFIGWFESDYYEGYELTEDTIVPPDDTTYYAHWALQHEITNLASYYDLNIYGTGISSLANNTYNITIYEPTGSNDQRWYVYANHSQVYIRSKIDKAFGLNVYRYGSPWNCNIHSIIGNEIDAQVDIIPAGNHCCIKLHNYNLYLTAGGISNGDNVYWSSYTGSDYQLWDCGIPTMR